MVSGTALVEKDGAEELIGENQSTYIPLGCKHRLSNPGKIAVELIEVQSGPYLGEDGIRRFEGHYGRSDAIIETLGPLREDSSNHRNHGARRQLSS